MFSHAEFNALLDQIGPRLLRAKERKEAIDKYDDVRKKSGIAAAERYLSCIVKTTSAKLKLKSIADQLQDFSAKNRINAIVDSKDEEKIILLSEKLDTDLITQAVRAQRLNEESIRRLAAPYSTHQNPTGHLKARRWLRKQAKQAIATLNMNLKLIGAHMNQHCTPFEIELRNQQKSSWLKFGEETRLTCTDKSTGELSEISMATIMLSANKKRVAEILTKTKGLEKYAQERGLTWIFLTLTAPASMHPNPSKGRDSWDGTTPDKAHQWIKGKYKNAVERLRKKGIIPSGVRVVEPHQDACPHWHILYFVRPSEIPEIEATFRQQPEWSIDAGMKEEHEEHDEFGMRLVENNGKASAASYLFKYVLKTVSTIEKLEGEHASVDAWRSTWAIRAFAFPGMPPAGLWQKLHSLKIEPDDDSLREIWKVVQDGNYCEFIQLAGGLNCKLKDRPFRAFEEKTETLSHENVKRICFENRLENTTTFFDSDKYKQEKIQDVQVILNYPRKATPPPSPQNPDPTPPFWLVMGYAPPKLKKNIIKKWRNEYIFDEEKERGWRNQDIFASGSISQRPSQGMHAAQNLAPDDGSTAGAASVTCAEEYGLPLSPHAFRAGPPSATANLPNDNQSDFIDLQRVIHQNFTKDYMIRKNI